MCPETPKINSAWLSRLFKNDPFKTITSWASPFLFHEIFDYMRSDGHELTKSDPDFDSDTESVTIGLAKEEKVNKKASRWIDKLKKAGFEDVSSEPETDEEQEQARQAAKRERGEKLVQSRMERGKWAKKREELSLPLAWDPLGRDEHMLIVTPPRPPSSSPLTLPIARKRVKRTITAEETVPPPKRTRTESFEEAMPPPKRRSNRLLGRQR